MNKLKPRELHFPRLYKWMTKLSFKINNRNIYLNSPIFASFEFSYSSDTPKSFCKFPGNLVFCLQISTWLPHSSCHFFFSLLWASLPLMLVVMPQAEDLLVFPRSIKFSTAIVFQTLWNLLWASMLSQGHWALHAGRFSTSYWCLWHFLPLICWFSIKIPL